MNFSENAFEKLIRALNSVQDCQLPHDAEACAECIHDVKPKNAFCAIHKEEPTVLCLKFHPQPRPSSSH